MTIVHIDLRDPESPAPIPAAGYLEWRPRERVVAEDHLVTTEEFTVPLVAGVAEVTVAGGYWWVTERIESGRRRLILIPDSGTVEYGDRPSIDPDTLDPIAPPVPAWESPLEAAVEQAAAAQATADAAVTAAGGASAAATTALNGLGAKADAADVYSKAQADAAFVAVAALSRDRLATRAAYDVARSQGISRTAYEDAATLSESWANLTAWSSSTFGQVFSNRLYSNGSGGNAGANRSFAVAADQTMRAVFNVTVTTDGNGSGALGVGVTNDTAGGAFTTGATKMRGLWFKANAQGIAQITDGTVSANLGPTGGGTTTWLVTLVVDEVNITMTAEKTDGSTIYSHKWARAGWAVNNIAVFNSCGGQLTGNSVGLLGARKSTVTITPRTGIEGVLRTTHWSTAGGDNFRITLPANYDSRRPSPAVLLFHGNGSDELHWASNTNGKAVADAFSDAGFITIAAANTGLVSTWGATAGLDAYVNAYRYARDHYNLGGLIAYANSMGSIESLLTLADDRIPGIAAWIGTVPTYDLAENHSNAIFTATINTAYGGDFAANSIGHDPALMNPLAFRGVPMYALVATDDAAVTPGPNGLALADDLAASNPITLVQVTGGHSTSQIASRAGEMVAFAKSALGIT